MTFPVMASAFPVIVSAIPVIISGWQVTAVAEASIAPVLILKYVNLGVILEEWVNFVI